MDHERTREPSGTSRREFLRLAGLGAAAVLAPGVLSACRSTADTTTTATPATTTTTTPTTTTMAPTPGRVLSIGYVSPETGPLSDFGAADAYVLGGVETALADGLVVNGSIHPIEVVTRDSQSDPVQAAAAAEELILDRGVDLMVVSATRETTNPVSEQCERNGVPCVSTATPWEQWFFGRGGDPARGFTWTYHYFWGMEALIQQYIALWDALDTNGVVGGLFPDDAEGVPWGDPDAGLPAPLEAAGYTLLDPGRYQNRQADFSDQIDAFAAGGAEIVTGVPLPQDFAAFWAQAADEGLTPLAATLGRAIVFPTAVEALHGDSGDGLSAAVWWSPSHPFRSSLTGETAAAFASGYTSATGGQWTQPLGFAHSLFEVAVDVLSRTEDVEDPESIRSALAATELDTLVGPVGWSSEARNPVPNVSTTPMTGGQWILGGDFRYDLAVVDNSLAPEVPTTAELRPIGG